MEFDVRNEEAQEMISAAPHWVVRHGIAIVFVTLLLVLCAARTVEYPREVVARIKVVTENPPTSALARTSGNLTLFIAENQSVRKGDRVAAVVGSATARDVLALKQAVDAFDRQVQTAQGWNRLCFENRHGLGEMEAAYSKLTRSIEAFIDFDRDDQYSGKIKTLEGKIIEHDSLRSVVSQQKDLVAKEADLTEKKVSMYESLRSQGLISHEASLRVEEERLQKQQALISAAGRLKEHDIRLTEYQSELAEHKRQIKERRTELLSTVRAAFDDLKSQLIAWEEKSILPAPADGRVSYTRFWGNNQPVKMGDEIFVIVPSRDGLAGIIHLPPSESGKVKADQTVRVKFDSYLSHDFGFVEAKVDSISLIPHEDRYLVRVSFPRGLQTSYGKALDFRQEMQGNAEIIIDKIRLIERILNGLSSTKRP